LLLVEIPLLVSVVAKLPARTTVHDVEPATFVYLPAEHGVWQEAAIVTPTGFAAQSLAKKPALTIRHAEEPAGLQYPVGHFENPALPLLTGTLLPFTEEANWPEAATKHAEAPARFAYFPLGHATCDEEPLEPTNWPMLASVHFDIPITFANDPALHSVLAVNP